ncbi:MPN555 family protein chaperone [Ureaplasma canigenitalium]|uniref:MPN555 family protein chaperone n=1 Tax=Ureaplasma canigenitalium TaxID=42092 RepID=UPI0004E27DCC|nr:hypothetical protein [Ureaplasma canigenitalium]
MDFKSKITNKKDIDWSYTIVLEELRVDPTALENHKQRIEKIFAKESDEEKAQQLHNIVVRDNLFSAAMDKLAEFYEFEFVDEDIKNLIPRIISAFGEYKNNIAPEIAKKIIQKTLIFKDLQDTFNIEIKDEELEKILSSYYEETNQPIRDFKENKAQWEAARLTLLEEKTTAFIIDKFNRDLSILEKNIREKLAKQMELEKQIESMTKKENEESKDKEETKKN